MPDDYTEKHLKLWTPATYCIEVEGHLDESWSDRLGGMLIKTRKRADQSTVTTLTGRLRDQAELTGVLKSLLTLMAISLRLAMGFGAALAAEEKSADEVAKELSNPAGSLASLNFNLQYTEFTGDLPGSDDQESWALTFQPVLPFPVGDKGRRIIFRPLVPVPLDQPVFNLDKGKFEDANVNLGDITFDIVYAGTLMKSKTNGFLWRAGAAGTLPTATDDDLGGNQWRLGPEGFGGIIREWGLVGALVSHQWNVGGSKIRISAPPLPSTSMRLVWAAAGRSPLPRLSVTTVKLIKTMPGPCR